MPPVPQCVHLVDRLLDTIDVESEWGILIDFKFAFLVKLSTGKGGGIGMEAA